MGSIPSSKSDPSRMTFAFHALLTASLVCVAVVKSEEEQFNDQFLKDLENEPPAYLKDLDMKLEEKDGEYYYGGMDDAQIPDDEQWTDDVDLSKHFGRGSEEWHDSENWPETGEDGSDFGDFGDFGDQFDESLYTNNDEDFSENFEDVHDFGDHVDFDPEKQDELFDYGSYGMSVNLSEVDTNLLELAYPEYFYGPYHIENSLSMPMDTQLRDWHILGSTILTSSKARLTPDLKGRKSALINSHRIRSADWQIHLRMHIHSFLKDGSNKNKNNNNNNNVHGNPHVIADAVEDRSDAGLRKERDEYMAEERQRTQHGGDGFALWILDEKDLVRAPVPIRKGKAGLADLEHRDGQLRAKMNKDDDQAQSKDEENTIDNSNEKRHRIRDVLDMEQRLLGDVFGLRPDFNGFGVVFDSFDNDGKGDNPQIFVLRQNITEKILHKRNSHLAQRLGKLKRIKKKKTDKNKKGKRKSGSDSDELDMPGVILNENEDELDGSDSDDGTKKSKNSAELKMIYEDKWDADTDYRKSRFKGFKSVRKQKREERRRKRRERKRKRKKGKNNKQSDSSKGDNTDSEKEEKKWWVGKDGIDHTHCLLDYRNSEELQIIIRYENGILSVWNAGVYNHNDVLWNVLSSDKHKHQLENPGGNDLFMDDTTSESWIGPEDDDDEDDYHSRDDSDDDNDESLKGNSKRRKLETHYGRFNKRRSSKFLKKLKKQNRLSQKHESFNPELCLQIPIEWDTHKVSNKMRVVLTAMTGDMTDIHDITGLHFYEIPEAMSIAKIEKYKKDKRPPSVGVSMFGNGLKPEKYAHHIKEQTDKGLQGLVDHSRAHHSSDNAKREATLKRIENLKKKKSKVYGWLYNGFKLRKHRRRVIWYLFWFYMCVCSLFLVIETLFEVNWLRTLPSLNRFTINRYLEDINLAMWISFVLHIVQCSVLIFSFHVGPLIMNVPLVLIRSVHYAQNKIGTLSSSNFDKTYYWFDFVYSEWIYVRLTFLTLSFVYNVFRFFF